MRLASRTIDKLFMKVSEVLTENLFSCKHCKKQFAFKVNLKRHMYLIHPNSTIVNSPTKSVQDYMEDSPELTTENNKSQDEFPKLDKFKCKICGVFCKSKRYLVAHIQSHFGG